MRSTPSTLRIQSPLQQAVVGLSEEFFVAGLFLCELSLYVVSTQLEIDASVLEVEFLLFIIWWRLCGDSERAVGN